MKPFRKFRENRSGFTAIVIALVITLVALAIILPVGMLVTANIQTIVNAMALGISGNATRTILFNNIWSAFNLSAIVPIIGAAGLIIGIILAAFAFRSSRR